MIIILDEVNFKMGVRLTLVMTQGGKEMAGKDYRYRTELTAHVGLLKLIYSLNIKTDKFPWSERKDYLGS